MPGGGAAPAGNEVPALAGEPAGGDLDEGASGKASSSLPGVAGCGSGSRCSPGQLARQPGARVIGTASARHASFLRELGCDQVIDYTTTDFAEVLSDVDVVLDTIGGDTQKRSFTVLRPGGWLVALHDPPRVKTSAPIRSMPPRPKPKPNSQGGP